MINLEEILIKWREKVNKQKERSKSYEKI